MSFSVLIQVHNEERHIEDCIESCKALTDSIVVIDMQSTDKTVEIAKNHSAQVIQYGSYPAYVEPAREFGIKQVKTAWVMILDADERMTKELASEIKETIIHQSTIVSEKEQITHFKIQRKNIFGGKKWLKHGGWWPDAQIRLLKTSSFKSWPKNIHSTPLIEGKTGFLKQPFLHYFHGDFKTMVEKTLLFEDIESELLYKAGKPVSVSTFFRKFFGELNRRLLLNKGYKDGEIGIIESIYQAFSKTITYLFLYEKKRRSL